MAASIFGFNGVDDTPVSAFLNIRFGNEVVIAGNKATSAEPNSNGGAAWALRDTGIADFDMTALMSSSGSATSARQIFRYVAEDDTPFCVVTAAGDIKIQTQDGSTQPTQYESALSALVSGFNIGDEVKVRLRGVGAVITLWVNDVFVADVNNFTNLTSTIHGIRIAGETSFIDDLSMEDNNPVTDDVANQAPTANAGPNQSIVVNSVVTLDGTGSTDSDGTIASYAWTQDSGPTVTLSDATASQPTFTPTVVGTYVFSLIVTDNGGEPSTNTSTITVNVSAETSTLTLDMTASLGGDAIPDGTYSVDFYNATSKGFISTANVAFSNGTSTSTIGVVSTTSIRFIIETADIIAGNVGATV